MAYKVSINYSSKDRDAVERVRVSVKTRPDIRVFVAAYSAPPGAPLFAQIAAVIRESDHFLLLWSGNAGSSRWEEGGLGRAVGAGRPVLPVRLDRDVELPPILGDAK